LGQHTDGVEVGLAEDAGLVEGHDEKVTGGEDKEQGIKVEGVSLLKEIEENGGIATRGARKDFHVGLSIPTVGIFTTHDNHAAVRHKNSSRVPTRSLKPGVILIFLPVICAGYSGTSVGSEKPNTE
jgi:hypothetical protein